VVEELCGWTKEKKESHGDEMGGLQSIIQVTIISHRLRRGTTHEVPVPSTRIGTRSARIHF